MQVEHLDYIIESDKYGHYNIKTKGKGSVIKELRGSYTSALKAIQAIDQYGLIKPRKIRRDRNGSSDSDSGDQYI